MSDGLLNRCFVIWTLSALGLLLGCNPTPPSSAPASKTTSTMTTPPAATAGDASGPVTIFAASSLTEVLQELKASFVKEHGVKVDLNLASSATLARQIERGASADLFFSAATEWADSLARKDYVAERSDRLENTLVLVVPRDSSEPIRGLKDLTASTVKQVALADFKSVPAGKYAKKALETEKLWEQIQSKIVTGEDVRQALMFVERGEAAAGLVYATDVAASKKVRIVAIIDEKLTGPIVYSLVLLKKGRQNSAAEEFYNFLIGPLAAEVYERHGFRIRKGEPK
jgi:molybdate transport system substrate-binding protein